MAEALMQEEGDEIPPPEAISAPELEPAPEEETPAPQQQTAGAPVLLRDRYLIDSGSPIPELDTPSAKAYEVDILDGMEKLKVCTGYTIDGENIDHLPASSVRQAKAVPVYEVMEGWSESTQGARSWADLPATAVKYIRRIEEIINAPVSLLSTSPKREDVILVHDPFAD